MATQITKQLLQEMSTKIERELEILAASYGVEIKYSGGKYGTSVGELKFAINPIADDGEVITRESKDFKTYATSYGLKSEDLGRRFNASGRSFEIIGAKVTSRVRPILAVCHRDGKTYQFPAEDVRRYLA